MGLPIFGSDSLLDSDTLTVSSENSSFPKENLSDDRIFTVFKPASIASPVTIKTDAGVGNTSDVDYFMMVGHDLFTQGSAFILESSPDDAAYSTVVASTTPTDDKIVARKFTKVTQRFFRLTVSGSAAVFSIGQVQWGTAVEIDFGMPVGHDPLSERVNGRFNRAQNGNILGTVQQYSERRARVQMELLTDTFIRGTSLDQFGQFYNNHARLLKPFLWAWNPANPGSFEKDAFFGILDPRGGIRRPLVTPLDAGFHDLSLSILGLAE